MQKYLNPTAVMPIMQGNLSNIVLLLGWNTNLERLDEYRNSQRVIELDRRIRELNEERADMYKTQSENAQRLVNLNEQLRAREEKDKKQTAE